MANYVSNLTVQVGDNSSATYNIRELFPHVGTCSTAAATAAKEVTIGNFKLYTGAWVVVKFNNTNSAAVASLTLNVDGTGAKPIKYRNANLGGAGDLAANRYTMFIYDGTNYQIVMDFNSNTYDRTSQQTRIYAGTIGVFNYSLCAMDNNQRMQSFTTTSGTGTAKTFNTSASFMYPVVIMYNAASSTYSNGTAIANNVLYEQYPSVDLRYSCNVTSTAGFTQYKPVYLECTINSDGTFKLTTTGLTQTFTNGKYYILLGCMYNTSIYQLALFAQHPMFYYDGTHLNGIVYTAAEKTKLSGIANGATKVESSSNGKIKINGTDTTVYTHPSHTSKTSGLYKITVDSLGHVSATAAVAKGDIPALDYSKVSISRSLTSGTKIGSITIDGTSTDLYCQTNTNTDTLVSQTFATADHNRPLLMSYYYTGIETTTAQIVHRNDALFFNPSSGILRSPRLYLQTTGMPITINLDTLQPAAGENVNVLSVRYKNTDGTATHTVYPIGILGNSATGSGAANNSGVRLGSTNGTTIVGAGESSVTFAAAQAKYNDESLYLVADQAVYMYTNCSNDATTVTGPWRVGGFTTGTAAITSGRVMITDGTTGGFKASDYTIAKSVPSDAKFSDTVTTVTTSGSGNAVTSITASNGALTVTKGSTFSLSTHTHDSLYGVSSTSAVPVTTLANGQLKVFYHVNNDLTGNMPASNNANAIIQINKHPGDYDAQLGFSSNGSIYYRSSNGTALSASVPWRKIYDTSNPPTASEVGALASTTKYAGSSSAGGAATSANKLNTNAGSATLPVYFSGGIPVVTTAPASGAWFSSFTGSISSSGVLEVGRYLDFHSTNAGTTDYDVRIDASSTSLLTITSNSGTPQLRLSGTLPRLRFTQTTSGKAYDNALCGISAYPGNTAGVNLVIQSGGNAFIGGGESPVSLYSRIITTDSNPYGTSSLEASEQMFITADNNIYFVSGAGSISATAYTDWTDLKTAVFDSNGYFRPSITDKGSIGTSSYPWHAGYINTLTSLGGAGGRTSVFDGNGLKLNVTSSTNWSMGMRFYDNAGETSFGGFGAYGTANAFSYHYIGPAYNNPIVKIERSVGTTSAVGYDTVTIGNSTASGTANNQTGRLTLYGTGAYAGTIVPTALSAARTYTLPNASGTISLDGHTHPYLPTAGTTINNPNTSSVSFTNGMSGNILFTNTGDTNGVARGIGGIVGGSDSWSVRGYQTATNKGCLEISVGDDGDEGIYVRQYTSGAFKATFSNNAGSASGLTYRELVLMAPSTGASVFPSTINTAGNITITKASGDTGFYATRSDTSVTVWMGVGSGGTNHGVYSNKLGKWMMYGDASNVYLNGNAATATTSTNLKVPRVAKDSKVFPGANKAILEEYTNGTSYNLPSNHFYHILSIQGYDTKYGTQLALGMTTTAAYYRSYNNQTWSAWKSIINTDTYDRNRYNANIKAGSSALVAANIIVGKDGVYKHLKSGGAFDITYPILYLNGAVDANGTTTNTYDTIHFTITTTQSLTLAAYRPVYIKGTLNGTVFTPVNTTPLTQTIPPYDTYDYIFLGQATSSTTVYLQERHPIYSYRNGRVQEITPCASMAATSDGFIAPMIKKLYDDPATSTNYITISDINIDDYEFFIICVTNNPRTDWESVATQWIPARIGVHHFMINNGAAPNQGGGYIHCTDGGVYIFATGTNNKDLQFTLCRPTEAIKTNGSSVTTDNFPNTRIMRVYGVKAF